MTKEDGRCKMKRQNYVWKSAHNSVSPMLPLNRAIAYRILNVKRGKRACAASKTTPEITRFHLVQNLLCSHNIIYRNTMGYVLCSCRCSIANTVLSTAPNYTWLGHPFGITGFLRYNFCTVLPCCCGFLDLVLQYAGETCNGIRDPKLHFVSGTSHQGKEGGTMTHTYTQIC